MRAAILAGLLLVAPFVASAAPPPGLTLDPAISAWFNAQRDQTGMSCCGLADGKILQEDEWRIGGASYEVLVDGVWRAVPDRAVVRSPDNPTGHAVVWLSDNHSRIYCLKPGTMT